MSNIKLDINGREIILTKGSYKEYPKVVESRNRTEAGTTHRDIVRTGACRIEVTTETDDTEKAFFDTCVAMDALTVQYWSEGTGGMAEKSMFIDPDSYKPELIVENGNHRFYTVSFVLEEF